MSRKDGLSILEKLLLASYDLEETGRCPFSAEDLVVLAWRKYPGAFGLAGYRDGDGKLAHPDSNRVFVEIMGSKPIRKRGLLRKVGKKMYQLTESGRDLARLLARRLGGLQVEKAGLARRTEREIRRLFSSRAMVKARGNRQGDTSFLDACNFWGISPRSTAIELQGRIANIEKVVASVQEVVREGSVSFEHGGTAFGNTDLEGLLRVHRDLMRRFQAELGIIRKRTDERK